MTVHWKSFSAHRGFTLIELMIVITVIGILASIGLVGFRGMRKKMTVKLAQEDADRIRACIESYYYENHKVVYATPSGSDNPNADVMKALMTPNKKGSTILEKIDRTRFNSDNEYLDPWKTPFYFKTIAKKNFPQRIVDVFVYSAGPDTEEAISMSGDWSEGVPLNPPIEVVPDIDRDNVYPGQ